MQKWLDASKRQRRAEVAELLARPDRAADPIEIVTAPHGWGVYASAGERFQYAIFGRDSIETAEDVLATHQQLAHDIIISLCKLQGIETNEISEEEPGKIHHEHRALRLDGFVIPEHSQVILRELQHVWGGEDGETMTYYGSFDATPLFIRLVGSYVETYGDGILRETLQHKSGQVVTVEGSVFGSLKWLERKITAHPLGLLAYKRLNPNGLPNQSWKDSYTSYLHADGSLPNFDGGIASIELQGYAYDALLAGTVLGLGNEDDRRHWDELARHLQQQTESSLWLDDVQYFAQGLDFDDNHAVRPIATITSNPAALLDSRLVRDLPTDRAEHYVKSVARMVFSPELLTSVGVRCRAVRHWDLLDYIDYHGPNTVWPKETFDIAKGLRRAGLDHLADNLEHRLAAGLRRAGDFSEFFYVSRDDTVWFDSAEALAHFGAESPGRQIPVPEPAQAWTIAAAIRLARDHKGRAADAPPSEFEREILANLD